MSRSKTEWTARVVRLAVIAGMSAGLAVSGWAQGSPGAAPPSTQAAAGGNFRFIVPFPAGGTLDVLARTIGNELGPALGKSLVVENRPGASGAIGAEVVARATPDGNTVFIASNTLVTLPAVRKNLPFDVFKDFAPVIELGSTPQALTLHPSFPAKTFAEFVSVAKSMPEKVSYNSPGIASPLHLAGELLSRAAGVPMVHVPYRGTQPAIADLIAGHIKVSMAPLNAVLPSVQDNKLLIVAVSDGTRSTYLPSVPTLRELGVQMPPVSSWFAVLTTGGTPPETVKRLNTEIARILRDPKIAKVLAAQTFEIKAGTPEELAALMKADAETNRKIVEEAGIKVE